MTAVQIVLGIAVAALVVSFGVAIVLCRGIRIADQAVSPKPAELQPTPVDPRLVESDDDYVQALADGRAALDNDPYMTRLIVAWRDESREGT